MVRQERAAEEKPEEQKKVRLCRYCGQPIPYPKGDYCCGYCAKMDRLRGKKRSRINEPF